MKLYHQVENLKVNGNILFLEVNGKNLEVNLELISPAFRKANPEELLKFELSPSGYGIHWPLLDEDISIDGLLGVVHSPKNNCQSA